MNWSNQIKKKKHQSSRIQSHFVNSFHWESWVFFSLLVSTNRESHYIGRGLCLSLRLFIFAYLFSCFLSFVIRHLSVFASLIHWTRTSSSRSFKKSSSHKLSGILIGGKDDSIDRISYESSSHASSSSRPHREERWSDNDRQSRYRGWRRSRSRDGSSEERSSRKSLRERHSKRDDRRRRRRSYSSELDDFGRRRRRSRSRSERRHRSDSNERYQRTATRKSTEREEQPR